MLMPVMRVNGCGSLDRLVIKIARGCGRHLIWTSASDVVSGAVAQSYSTTEPPSALLTVVFLKEHNVCVHS